MSRKDLEEPNDDTIARKTSRVKLQDYQLAPIKRIVSRCKNQKGVLVYYDTGTGKTYIGLSFIQNFPEYNIYVIIPETLLFIWRGSETNINSKVKITYVTHSFLENNIFTPDTSKPYVIVVDEAHNLLRVIGKGTKYGVENYSAIGSAKKLLLMTATPFVDGINDIAILINLCAGKKLLEPDVDLFHKYYKKPITKMSFLRGWLLPAIANRWTFGIIYGISFMAGFFEIMHNLKGDYGHASLTEEFGKQTLHGSFFYEGDREKSSGLQNYFDEDRLMKIKGLEDSDKDKFIEKWHLEKRLYFEGDEARRAYDQQHSTTDRDHRDDALITDEDGYQYAYFYPGTDIKVVIPDHQTLTFFDTDRTFLDSFSGFMMNILTFGQWNSYVENMYKLTQAATSVEPHGNSQGEHFYYDLFYQDKLMENIRDKLSDDVNQREMFSGQAYDDPDFDSGGSFRMMIVTMINYLIIFIVCKHLLIREEYLPEIDELDSTKIIDLCRPYILVYQKDSKINENFPDHETKVVEIPYDRYQLNIWLKLTLGYVHEDFYIRNGIRDVSTFGKTMDNAIYIDKGRSISNLPLEYSDKAFIYPTKFYMVLSKIFTMTRSERSSIERIQNVKRGLIDFLGENELAKLMKFDIPDRETTMKKLEEVESVLSSILQGMAQTKDFDNSVVYSNFDESGSKIFVEFLKRYKIPHSYLHPKLSPDESKKILDSFKGSKKQQLLVLHPSMKEGIDIRGARQFHILEPIMKISDKIQIQGRVVRFQSHTHLDKSERNVTIYEWVSSNRNWSDGVVAYFENFKSFIKHDTYVSFAYFRSKISQLESPESIVHKQSERFTKYIIAIQKTAEIYNSQDREEDFSSEVCNVWEPDNTNPDKPCSKVLYSEKYQ